MGSGREVLSVMSSGKLEKRRDFAFAIIAMFSFVIVVENWVCQAAMK